MNRISIDVGSASLALKRHNVIGFYPYGIAFIFFLLRQVSTSSYIFGLHICGLLNNVMLLLQGNVIGRSHLNVVILCIYSIFTISSSPINPINPKNF